MKHLLLLLLLFLNAFLCLPVWANPDGDEGEPIPIQVNEPGEEDDKNGFRSPAIIPIQATWLNEEQCVEVVFLQSLGEVTIRFKNLSNMTVFTTVVDSACCNCFIPVLCGSAFYSIQFVTADGGDYLGFFNVGV